MNSLKPVGNFRWTICALLFFATTINYLDRQVLSLLKPLLEDQYHWTNRQYAHITTAFQLTYAISLVFAGRIIDSMGTRKGYAWAIVVWSIGAIIHASAIPIGDSLLPVLGWLGIVSVPASVIGFMFTRAFLAVGESANFPAAIKATAEYFPRKERSFATGIFNSGANVGAILAPLTVPWLAQHWGWQSAFVIVGGIGFLWLLFWLFLYQKPEQQPRLGKAELEYILSDESSDSISLTPMQGQEKKVKWVQLLHYRQTWAFFIGKFLTDGVWWFFLFWLPAYLKDHYQLTGTGVMLPLAVLYSLTMFGSIGGGAFPTYFINKGWKPYDGRMKAMLLIAFFPLVVLLAQPFGYYSYWVPVLLIGIGASAHAAWSANIFTTVSDMFPKKTVGAVVGIGGMAGGLGSVIITEVGGALFDHYKKEGHIEIGYNIMFAYCAVAYLLAWILMKTLVPKEKQVEI